MLVMLGLNSRTTCKFSFKDWSFPAAKAFLKNSPSLMFASSLFLAALSVPVSVLGKGCFIEASTFVLRLFLTISLALFN